MGTAPAAGDKLSVGLLCGSGKQDAVAPYGKVKAGYDASRKCRLQRRQHGGKAAYQQHGWKGTAAQQGQQHRKRKAAMLAAWWWRHAGSNASSTNEGEAAYQQHGRKAAALAARRGWLHTSSMDGRLRHRQHGSKEGCGIGS